MPIELIVNQINNSKNRILRKVKFSLIPPDKFDHNITLYLDMSGVARKYKFVVDKTEFDNFVKEYINGKD